MSQPNLPNRSEIARICANRNVVSLVLFGSAVTGEFDDRNSDYDFLVDFDDNEPDLFRTFFGLKDDLEQLFGRPVDLVSRRAMKNEAFIKAALSATMELYAR